MILVRDVFRLKFGKARDAKALMQEAKKIDMTFSSEGSRILFDLTGPSYTMVLETLHKNLSAWETTMSTGMNQDAWKAWYQKFQLIVETSHREIFTVME